MAYCTGCGDELGSAVAVCPKCGTPIPAGSGALHTGAANDTGLRENVAAFLCYVVGWLTGLVFFLIDKRPLVRFHAAQSMITFGVLHLLQLIFVRSWMMAGGVVVGRTSGLIMNLLGVLTFVAWIVCMVKAYKGERFKLPIVGDIAESIAK